MEEVEPAKPKKGMRARFEEQRETLDIIKEQTDPAKIEEIVQALLAQQSEQDAANIMAFLNTAIQYQGVQNSKEFEKIQKGLEELNKPGSDWETKIKLGLPLAALTGIDIGFEGKVDLKKVMKKIVGKTNELAERYNIDY